MKSIILAAGYATRLYPLTKNKPKSLLMVGKKPIIEHIIDKLEEIEELDEIFIITNDKFFGHFEKWLKNFKFTKKIKIINDKTKSNDDRLGAIGDIEFAINREKINDNILVIAGDNLFEFSLIDIIELSKKKNSTVIALYDVKDKGLAKQYGIVAINENNKIIHFEEKPKKPKSTLASTGIYLFKRNTLKDIREYIKRGYNTDKTGFFLEWFYKREDVCCFVSKKRWYDIGSFEQLEEAKREYKSK